MRGTRRLALVATLILSACTVGPDYKKPEYQPPAQFIEKNSSQEVASTDALRSWWGGFHDPLLSDLIEQAISGNYDLQIATQRIRQASDMVRFAESADLPQIGFGAAVENRREPQTLDWPPPTPYGEYPYYQLGFNAAWEIDIFGENRRRKEAAQDAAEAAIEDRRGILISLTAAVANTYISYRAAEARLRIAQDDLDVARKVQALTFRSFSAGETSHLDVSEADAQLHTVEAVIPPLRAEAAVLVHAMAVLLGKVPEAFTAADLPGDSVIPAAPPLPPSMPSEVIARRPDIRRAERDYARSNADIGVAIAAEYPHFSIPLAIGPTTSAISSAFQLASEAWRFGLDSTQSLYTGGRLDADIEFAKAGNRAALLSYRQTILKAFAEVEDSLSNQLAERERFTAVTAQLFSSQHAFAEATERYRNGQIGFLPVLDSQRQFYATRDALVATSLARTLASINLYKAIGGGWEGVALPDPAAAEAPVALSRNDHG